MHSRHRHGKAVETYKQLNKSAGFEIQQAAQKDFRRAIELFGIYDSLAFGDATIVAYMGREGIKYLYSFDDDFDVVEGLTRLNTPDNPYR